MIRSKIVFHPYFQHLWVRPNFCIPYRWHFLFRHSSSITLNIWIPNFGIGAFIGDPVPAHDWNPSSEIVIIMDSMDQAKFSCPRSNVYRSKELNTLQRPRLHITLAIVHGYFLAISVSSPDLPKDSTTMCELLAHCLTLLQRQGVLLSKVSLTVQSDNTPREYKNNPFLRFLAFLTSNQIVATATLRTLRTGNTCYRFQHGGIR